MERFTPDDLVPDCNTFGPALAKVRGSLGVSQRELASYALVADSTIAAYESKRRDASPEALVRLAVACGVEPASAVMHVRLLTDELMLKQQKQQKQQKQLASPGSAVAAINFMPGSAGDRLVRGSAWKLLGPALAAGAVASAVSAARASRERRRLEGRLDHKLYEAATSSLPVPEAERRGIYPLVEKPPREHLLKSLESAAKVLADEELYALVSALYAGELQDEHAEA